MAHIEIKTDGIKKTLKTLHKNNPKQAIAEYIWNGFDANATEIVIEYTFNDAGSIETLKINDDGSGINLFKIEEKFKNFYESKKANESELHKHHSTIHGMNGVGRLTFTTFALTAVWETCFRDDQQGKKKGSIKIKSNDLENYSDPVTSNASTENIGTCVSFYDFSDKFSNITIENEVIPFLISEFCWYLELRKNDGIKIKINGNELKYDPNILVKESDISLTFNDPETETPKASFNIDYIQWKRKINTEQSKIYLLNSKGDEVYKQFTTFNRKGDKYYHSVYVQSSIFDSFEYFTKEDEKQVDMISYNRTSPEYKYLIAKINELLYSKRKPFLHIAADIMINEYESTGILPDYSNEWEMPRKKILCDTIKGFYEVQPILFTSLSVPQKKTFVRFLDLLIDSNEKDRVFAVLDDIVELTPEERESLSEILKKTKLSSIIETIKLIEDRFIALMQLKEMVYNPDLGANEVDHLQKMIESHYWIFGEEYHLVTAAEPKFEEALRRYIYKLTEIDEPVKIDHPHRLKEMDIFACRQSFAKNRIDNIVVELKHPNIKLGRNQLNQVDNYLQVILSKPEFNADNMHWEFYLIGNEFHPDDYIDRQLNTNKANGIPSLVYKSEDGRVKIFVKRWSEVFTDFEIKYKHLEEKLKFERDQLAELEISADEIIEKSKESTAVQPEEVSIK
jgi:Histidine kinase-, DNA gyrase B-, and HSP90-like ATPase